MQKKPLKNVAPFKVYICYHSKSPLWLHLSRFWAWKKNLFCTEISIGFFSSSWDPPREGLYRIQLVAFCLDLGLTWKNMGWSNIFWINILNKVELFFFRIVSCQIIKAWLFLLSKKSNFVELCLVFRVPFQLSMKICHSTYGQDNSRPCTFFIDWSLSPNTLYKKKSFVSKK